MCAILAKLAEATCLAPQKKEVGLHEVFSLYCK